MKSAVRTVAGRPLHALRSRSNRLVHLVPDSGVGFGNILYMLLAAHRARQDGREAYATRTSSMETWLHALPGMEELVIRRSDMRFLDERRQGWYQYWAEVEPALESFVRDRLLTSPRWRGAFETDPGEVTVNVRRGDYYSVPAFRELYGFNIAGYVRVALEGSREQAPVSSVRVISDDPGWCRENLGFVAEFGEPRWQSPTDGPIDNLFDLARSRRLILANSTFSYWGGYMSNVAHTDNHELVWVPSFHTREWGDHVVAWHLDPRWSVVSQVPGGWDEPADQLDSQR